jgi:transposase
MSSEVNMSNKNKHRRPKYTLEFKKDAAKFVNEKGYTHKQAANNLGISLGAFGWWVQAEHNPTTTDV